MGLTSNVQNMMGIVTVQIEGFFTERFINLCRINNVKIWDIRNVVKGIVRFKINIYEFKKLKKIAKKTKCKVTIKDKKGIYFFLFKYRKRKLIFILISLVIFFSILFSTYIWNIEVEGNEYIDTDKIITKLKESGMYIGKNKIGLDKKEVVNALRTKVDDISWAGIDIDGTKAIIKIVEKTKLDGKNVQNSSIGNVVAQKSGIITKIVPENGTAKFKIGSYIEAGTIGIEGTIYSKYIDPIKVSAKGILRVDCEYELVKEYRYEEIKREYQNKNLYTIGIGINSKENMLNYLNKSKKYDITKYSKEINLFGFKLSFDLYKCSEYKEINVTRTKEELIEIARKEAEEYILNEIKNNTTDGVLKHNEPMITEIEDGISVTTKFVINEEVGKFIEGE
ncbi:MAG: sporulation protein YqfD [Clostridia bacterium]|nr:sporulation protein YqfD [Clostridia bacterium]